MYVESRVEDTQVEKETGEMKGVNVPDPDHSYRLDDQEDLGSHADHGLAVATTTPPGKTWRTRAEDRGAEKSKDDWLGTPPTLSDESFWELTQSRMDHPDPDDSSLPCGET